VSYVAGVILASVAHGLVGQHGVPGVVVHARLQIISRRQLVLRLCTGALLVVCISLIFVASVHRLHDPWLALLLWTAISVLPLVAIILAWVDLREVRRTKHVRQAELYRTLARIQEDLKAKDLGKR